MGKLYLEYFNSGEIYMCSICSTHLTLSNDLISRAFHGRYGRALLFNNVINVYKGTSSKRPLTTGMHEVCDIYCTKCHEYLGWYYIDADSESQKYKIGKYIIEKKCTNIKNFERNN